MFKRITSNQQPRHDAPSIHVGTSAPQLQQPAYSADLFDAHFLTHTTERQAAIAYGNNGRVEIRRDGRQDPPSLVAVKVQPRSVRSLRERDLLQRAQSEHVISLHGVFEIAQSHGPRDVAFVMPVAVPLPDVLKNITNVASGRSLHRQVGGDIFSAIDFLHALGIYHRDIKADNILLQGQKALLGDFGEAYAPRTRPFEALYRWSDVRDSAALMVVMFEATQDASAAHDLTAWLGQHGGGTLSTLAVRRAFVHALHTPIDVAVGVSAPPSASKRYQFWRLVQLIEKEVDSVRKKGIAMTVRQSMPQWNAAAYDRQQRPWAYTREAGTSDSQA